MSEQNSNYTVAASSLTDMDSLNKVLNKRKSDNIEDGSRALIKNDTNSRRKIHYQRIVLEKIESDLEKHLDKKDNIFISFSGSDNPYYSFAVKKALSVGFQVKTGPMEEDKDNFLNESIRKTILKSSAFLGIWTKEYSGKSVRDETLGGIPSAWLPFELGVATAHGIPFRLCVKDEVHKDFREKLESNQAHAVFDSGNFEEKIEKCIDDLFRRVLERRAEILDNKVGR